MAHSNSHSHSHSHSPHSHSHTPSSPPPPPPTLTTFNPRPFLLSLLTHQCTIRLKWGVEYRGILFSLDNYINVHLSDCDEFINGKFKGKLGEVIIRCNNILYIKEGRDDVSGGEQNSTISMETKEIKDKEIHSQNAKGNENLKRGKDEISGQNEKEKEKDHVDDADDDADGDGKVDGQTEPKGKRQKQKKE